ncbi:hypothetical protein [Amaricoccus sp.]|nr:hypothetical protein [Amaricoccus sp.]
MRLALKGLLWLVVLGAIGLAGFALLSDLPAPTREISLPVEPR